MEDNASETMMDTYLECLALEREAERAECNAVADTLTPAEQQRRGMALHKLRIASIETVLFGRVQLTLQLSGGRPLPPTKLSGGALVALRPATTLAAGAASGTVTALRASSISVSFDEMPEEQQLVEPLTLSLLYNDVTYRRLESTVNTLRAGDKVPRAAAALCRALLSDETTTRAAMAAAAAAGDASEPLAASKAVNNGLNDGQRRAIGFGLAASPIALIHGPPGTGKTTAVVELIRQAVMRGERVLASAASNIAVDNMAERLLSGTTSHGKQLKIVRVGHPARLLPSVLEASLDARLATSDGAAIVRDVKSDLDGARAKLRKERAKGGRAALKAEVGALRKELNQRQRKSVTDLLQHAQVVLCTNTGAADRALGCLPVDFAFDLVVIDEAAQALEASCWVALLRGKRAVLAGDHLQLPPVVKSEAAEKKVRTPHWGPLQGLKHGLAAPRVHALPTLAPPCAAADDNCMLSAVAALTGRLLELPEAGTGLWSDSLRAVAAHARRWHRRDAHRTVPHELVHLRVGVG